MARAIAETGSESGSSRWQKMAGSGDLLPAENSLDINCKVIITVMDIERMMIANGRITVTIL